MNEGGVVATRADEFFAMAKARQEAGDVPGAANLYGASLQENPCHVGSLNNLAYLLKDNGLVPTAIVAYRRAHALAPEDVDIKVNLARALFFVEKYQEALDILLEARAQAPERGDVWHNMGHCYVGLNQCEAALKAFDKALELVPAATIRWDRSLCLLSMGDYRNGWEGHDARFDTFHPKVRQIPLPLWMGEPLEGKSLWIHADQGAGDAIMAARYIPMICEQAAEVIVDVPGPLDRLLRQLPGPREWRVDRSLIPRSHDCYHIPLFSLIGRLGIDLDIVDGRPYLNPVHGAEAIRLPGRKRVGLVWAGTAAHPRDRWRSMDFGQMVAIAEDPSVSWYSFQTGSRAADLASLMGNALVRDISPLLIDYAATASYLRQLDALVTVDTSIAHLAGALGVKTFLMLASIPDWRWLRSGDTTPWYNSVTLIRQREPGDWEEAIGRAQRALMAHLCN